MWKALTEPYANTEYLLGIQLPEESVQTTSLHDSIELEERTSQPSASFIAALEETPRPAYTSCFGASTSQMPSSSSSLQYFTPLQSPVLDDDSDSWSEEPTPDPSPLFTPADTGSECDPFDVALDQDVLDLDAVSQALQETAHVVTAKVEEAVPSRWRQEGFALHGLVASQRPF